MTVNLSSNAYANMYSKCFGTTMANDYFGSQIFGSKPFCYQQQNQVVFSNEPTNLASSLVQQHAAATNTSTVPSMQDYMYATQVANMFAGQNAMLTPYTSFTQNDMFAQQTVPSLLNNCQYYA